MPTAVVTGMPAGTSRLYLFFDYNNMRDGIIYELRTTQDGVPNPTFSLAPATWNGGKSGMWYIGSSAQTWLAHSDAQGVRCARMAGTWVRDHLAASLSIESRELLDPPFSQRGGLGRARELFGPGLDALLTELSEAIAA